MSDGILTTRQADVKTRLEAQEFFSDSAGTPPNPISIFTEDIGDIDNAIATAVGKVGVCVVVITPIALAGNDNAPGPLWNELIVVARVFENVLINRTRDKDGNLVGNATGVPASTIAEAIAWHLGGFTPEGAGACFVVESITIGNDPNHLTYDVNMKTADGLTAAPTRS